MVCRSCCDEEVIVSLFSVDLDADTKDERATQLYRSIYRVPIVSKKGRERPRRHASKFMSHLRAHSKNNRASMEPRVRSGSLGAVDIIKRSVVS